MATYTSNCNITGTCGDVLLFDIQGLDQYVPLPHTSSRSPQGVLKTP